MLESGPVDAILTLCRIIEEREVEIAESLLCQVSSSTSQAASVQRCVSGLMRT